MADDAASELARNIVQGFTPTDGWLAKGGSFLNNLLSGFMKESSAGNGGNLGDRRSAPPLQQPLPRIVPNQAGDLIDLNTGKAVGRVGPQSKETSLLNTVAGNYKTDQQLEKAGSVMAPSKVADRETLQNQGPLMYTLLNMLKGGGLDPTTASGPTGGGANLAHITPGTWASMEPNTKNVLRKFFDKFPDVENAVQKVGTKLLPNILPKEQVGEGLLGMVNREAGAAGEPIDVMKLLKSPRLPGFNPSEETLIHELQHHINGPRVTATDPADAGTIGLLGNDILASRGADRNSLAYRIGQLERQGGLGGDPTNMVKRSGWQQFTPQTKAAITHGYSPYQSSKMINDPYLGKEGPTGDFLNRMMMDEFLSHLSQHTVTGGDKALVDLANKLKVGTKHTPKYDSQLLDDVMQSINQLQK